MRTLLLSLALFAMAASAALATPIRLTDRQLDKLTAGSWKGPVRVVWPTQPPVINPGGPILISCTIGVGCTVRHYR